MTLRPMISHVSCAKLRLPTYHLPLVCSTMVRTRTLVHFTSPNTIGSARKLQVKRKKKKKNFFLKLLLFPRQHLTGRWVVNRCESSSAATKKKSIYPANGEAAAIERITQLNSVHGLPQYRHHSGMSIDILSL